MITEAVSSTNKPPIIAKTISCFEIMLTAPKDPPKDKEPVSPIKIFAGGKFQNRNPAPDASNAAAISIITSSLLLITNIRTNAFTKTSSEPARPSIPSIKLYKFSSQRRARMASTFRINQLLSANIAISIVSNE